MSILDAQLEFSNAQAVTSTAISTNVVDLGDDATLRNIGGPSAPYVVIITNTTCTDNSSDATLTITLESDSAAALNASVTTHYSTATMAFATFATAGTVLAMFQLPVGNYERYLGVRYTVASGPLTAGAFDAFITRDPQFWIPQAANNPAADN